jgi:hypothetical protein
MAGRVRGVSGHTRVAIEHGWELAATPAGERKGPAELDGLAWHPARVPGTAASALPDHGNYDAHDWWWRAPLNPELTAGTTLGFDGIATLWDAWVDGVHVASADSMWATREANLEHGAHEQAAASAMARADARAAAAALDPHDAARAHAGLVAAVPCGRAVARRVDRATRARGRRCVDRCAARRR